MATWLTELNSSLSTMDGHMVLEDDSNEVRSSLKQSNDLITSFNV